MFHPLIGSSEPNIESGKGVRHVFIHNLIDPLIFLPLGPGGSWRIQKQNLRGAFEMCKVLIDNPIDSLILPPSWARRPLEEPKIETESALEIYRVLIVVLVVVVVVVVALLLPHHPPPPPPSPPPL